MKHLLIFFNSVLLIIVLFMAFKSPTEKSGQLKSPSTFDKPVLRYDRNGIILKQIRIFTDTFAITSATQTFDISAAGFTSVKSVSVEAEGNTSTANNVPMALVKNWTTSSLTVNFVQGNSTAVSILGVNVLGVQFLQSFAGYKCHIICVGQ